MTWDPVPWFIGGGAEHSPEVTRLLAYAATRGAEGIVGVTDCKVSALANPGAGFTIDSGAVIIYNRSAGGTQQSYVARMATPESLTGIAATGAGAGRSDLVVVRIKDPQYSPWQPPADRRVGPYLETFVIQGVPSTTTTAKQLNLGYPAVALARIDIPPSTGTITNAMIKDVRRVANPRTDRQIEIDMPGATQNYTTGADNIWVQGFPFAANALAVPDYATSALVVITVSGLAIMTGDTIGEIRANFLGQTSPVTKVDVNYGGSTSRTTFAVGGRFAVPATYRGTDRPITLDMRRIGGTGAMRVDGATTVTADVTFQERAE